MAPTMPAPGRSGKGAQLVSVCWAIAGEPKIDCMPTIAVTTTNEATRPLRRVATAPRFAPRLFRRHAV